MKVATALLSIGFAAVFSYGEEFRIFRDTNGRVLAAKVRYVEDDVVSLVKKGSGVTFTLPVSKFSGDDQIYLRDFMQKYYVPALRISVTKKIVAAKTETGDFSRTTEKGHEYEVTIENIDTHSLKNITAEYRVFGASQEVTRYEYGTTRRSEKEPERAVGSAIIQTLNPLEPIKFLTASGMTSSRSSSTTSIDGTHTYGNLTITYSGFGSSTTTGTSGAWLRGIWIKLLYGPEKRLITESKFGVIPKDESWP